MATLLENFTTLRNAASTRLRFGITAATSGNESTLIDLMVKRALQWVYWPEPVQVGPGTFVAPDWTFLRQWARLTIHEDYATGTVKVTNASAAVTLAVAYANGAHEVGDVVKPTVANGYHYRCTTAGTAVSEPTWVETVGGTNTDGTVIWTCEEASAWPSWVAAGKEIAITDGDGSTTIMTVLARVSDDQITLSANWAGDSEVGLNYVMRFGSVALPSDFGSPLGPVIVENAGYSGTSKIELCDSGEIYDLIAAGQVGSSPRMAALLPSSHAGASVQLHQLIVWPAFEGTVRLRYRVEPPMLDSAEVAVAYAYGGAAFHELILSAVNAACEERIDGVHGTDWQTFRSRLAAVVLADARMEPELHGRISLEGARPQGSYHYGTR